MSVGRLQRGLIEDKKTHSKCGWHYTKDGCSRVNKNEK